ncbi:MULTISPECIES: hypothetical protein [Streptomyces]|uniref:hypothetical protein n=1 Tax=Streptomyces TaxID=1883 RepID=UPI0012FF4660|nr:MULTISPECIES: hypothetical protein [Streptomyces]
MSSEKVAGISSKFGGPVSKDGRPAVFAAAGEAARTIYSWDHETGVSAAALAAPLARLGTAVAPLLRNETLGPAATDLYEAAVKHSGDHDRAAAAMRAFHEALRSALAPPAPPPRRRRFLRRRSDLETLPRD